MPETCPHCRQPLPAEPRRDPPLPPLEHPNVVTIHDLPEGVKAEVVVDGPNKTRLLALPESTEGGGDGG